MGYYILIFEIAIIIFYGIFVRTGYTAVSSFADLEAPLYFTLAFTLLHFKHRMYDWTQLTNLLFVAAITFQLNTLFFMFWESSFYRSFNSTTNVSSFHLIINIECTLAILVTIFQFVGRFTPQQIFALSLVEIFAFALNFSINQLGINIVTQVSNLSQPEEQSTSSSLGICSPSPFASSAAINKSKINKNNGILP